MTYETCKQCNIVFIYLLISFVTNQIEMRQMKITFVLCFIRSVEDKLGAI